MRVYNTASGDMYHELHGHSNSIYAVAFSPQGQRALTAGGDGDAIVWDIIRGAEILRVSEMESGNPPMFGCDWSPTGTAVLLPRGLTGLAEWSPTSGERLREYDAGGYVLTCAYSPDGRQLAASMRNGAGRVRVWSATDGALLHQLGPSGRSALHPPLAFSPDSKTLLTSQGDDCKTLQLFCMETGALLVDEGDCGHKDAIAAVAFAPVRRFNLQHVRNILQTGGIRHIEYKAWKVHK